MIDCFLQRNDLLVALFLYSYDESKLNFKLITNQHYKEKNHVVFFLEVLFSLWCFFVFTSVPPLAYSLSALSSEVSEKKQAEGTQLEEHEHRFIQRVAELANFDGDSIGPMATHNLDLGLGQQADGTSSRRDFKPKLKLYKHLKTLFYHL